MKVNPFRTGVLLLTLSTNAWGSLIPGDLPLPVILPPPLDQTPPLIDISWPIVLVYAGKDLTTSFGNDIMLNGEVFADPVTNLTITWSLVSGPGTVSFTDPAAPFTTASFSLVGVYGLALTACNNEACASDTVSVNITVPEPSCIMLLGLGSIALVGIGMRRRR